MNGAALAAIGGLALAAAIVAASLAWKEPDERSGGADAAAATRYSVYPTVDKLANCADCHYGISVPFRVETTVGDGAVELRVGNAYANMTLRALRIEADYGRGPADAPPPGFPVIDPSEGSPAVPYAGQRELVAPLDRVKGWKESWEGSLALSQAAAHTLRVPARGHLLVHLDGASPDNEGEVLTLEVLGPDGGPRPVQDERGDLRQAVLPEAPEGDWTLRVARSEGKRPLHDYVLSATWFPLEVDFTDVLATGDEVVRSFPFVNGTAPTLLVGAEPFHDHHPFEQPEPYDETNYTLLIRPAGYPEPPAPAPGAPPPEALLADWRRRLALSYVPREDGDVGIDPGAVLGPASPDAGAFGKGGAKFGWYLPPGDPVQRGVEEVVVDVGWQQTPGFPGFGLRFSTPAYMHFLVPEPEQVTATGATFRIAVREGWHDPAGSEHWNWDFAAYVQETPNEPVVYDGAVTVRVTALAPASLQQ